MSCAEPAVAGKKKKKTMKQADMDSLFASVGTEAAPSAPLENGVLLLWASVSASSGTQVSCLPTQPAPGLRAADFVTAGTDRFLTCAAVPGLTAIQGKPQLAASHATRF